MKADHAAAVVGHITLFPHLVRLYSTYFTSFHHSSSFFFNKFITLNISFINLSLLTHPDGLCILSEVVSLVSWNYWYHIFYSSDLFFIFSFISIPQYHMRG
eukprot:TRINITY_DN8618_c0_g1_i1.p1 TRINITY_DN8618_c0_g1~~TRINITY_DN8618_c0_g1_i1.p1  ORF type:complete len:101 (+),score=15.95 TRINITY_DN8618_c0_g1_i1:214-516(+)